MDSSDRLEQFQNGFLNSRSALDRWQARAAEMEMRLVNQADALAFYRNLLQADYGALMLSVDQRRSLSQMFTDLSTLFMVREAERIYETNIKVLKEIRQQTAEIGNDSESQGDDLSEDLKNNPEE